MLALLIVLLFLCFGGAGLMVFLKLTLAAGAFLVFAAVVGLVMLVHGLRGS